MASDEKWIVLNDGISTMPDQSTNLRLGDPTDMKILSNLLPDKLVEFSHECEGSCYIITGDYSTVVVYTTDYGLAKFIVASDSDVTDLDGNRLGDLISKVASNRPMNCEFESCVTYASPVWENISYVTFEEEKCFPEVYHEGKFRFQPCARIDEIFVSREFVE